MPFLSFSKPSTSAASFSAVACDIFSHVTAITDLLSYTSIRILELNHLGARKITGATIGKSLYELDKTEEKLNVMTILNPIMVTRRLSR